jgi:coenzyme F420-reducing hydrogenase gamma subunit
LSVDAGSCNDCEVEIQGLNSPVYDIERFGIHFVASPRHADMLLVTGPVTRNMELALRKTYDAMPAPRLVVAAGTCGCSGGIFGTNHAIVGSVDAYSAENKVSNFSAVMNRRNCYRVRGNERERADEFVSALPIERTWWRERTQQVES